MPPVPDNFPDLAIAGYTHIGGGQCKACGTRLEWFRTRKGKLMPFSLIKRVIVGETAFYEQTSDTRYEPHWSSCPKADMFRKQRRKSA